MKPKLTTENKAKIEMLYFGQNVGRIEGSTKKIKVIEESYYDYLELRPLSSIKDEEARELGYENAKEFCLEIPLVYYNSNECDYLRMKGIALDWCGWSVEELVKEGVFVLKE